MGPTAAVGAGRTQQAVTNSFHPFFPPSRQSAERQAEACSLLGILVLGFPYRWTPRREGQDKPAA